MASVNNLVALVAGHPASFTVLSLSKIDKTFTRSLHANLATAMEDASQNNVALSVASEIALVAHFLRCRFYFPKIKGTPAGSTFPDERVESLWRNLSIKYADIIRSCPIDDEIDICQGTNAKRRRLC